MQFILIFNNFLNSNSKLFIFTINFYLNNLFDEFTNKLIELINQFDLINELIIPINSPSISHCKLFHCLYVKSNDFLKKNLEIYLLNCLKFAKPFILYKNTLTIKHII